MNRPILAVFLLLITYTSNAQTYYQYFDGKDTSVYNSILVTLDTGSNNIWQIGKPQKNIFDSAATKPNALVTDTANLYPKNNTSRFSFRLNKFSSVAIVAIRWKQKLNMGKQHAGGIVEYTTDSGKTWKNVFNNPQVYRFYGFDTVANRDTMNGQYVLTGTDTTWKDIWLCFQGPYLRYLDSFAVRFTFMSDTSSNTGEGWMIDDMMAHPTYFHTVRNTEEGKALKVYPSATKGLVTIEVVKTKEEQFIKNVIVFNSEGKIIQQHNPDKTVLNIDIGNQPSGLYYVKVNTNLVSLSYPVMLSK